MVFDKIDRILHIHKNLINPKRWYIMKKYTKEEQLIYHTNEY